MKFQTFFFFLRFSLRSESTVEELMELELWVGVKTVLSLTRSCL